MAATRLAVFRDTPDCDIACAVAAHAMVEACPEAMETLRTTLGQESDSPLPPRFLRYADEQTVVGMAAVLQAMAAFPVPRTDFSDWGVLAAPCLLGRINGACTLSKFQQSGPAAVSPHAIPQLSLHSVSSAISVGLGMHGPNFGIGGGPESLAEGLTVGLSFLDETILPGIWLVFTQWDREPIPDGLGGSCIDTVCRAVAMALVPGTTAGATLRLSLWHPLRRLKVVGLPSRTAPPDRRPGLMELSGALAALTAGNQSARWSYPLPWGGRMELLLVAKRHMKAV